jgi:hypothetical protein
MRSRYEDNIIVILLSTMRRWSLKVSKKFRKAGRG